MDRFGDWGIWITGIVMGFLVVPTSAGCHAGPPATVNASDVYQTACARCHGHEGRGGPPPEPGGPSPRNFTDPTWQESASVEQIRATIVSGKGPMPSFQGVLSPEEIDAVIEVVRSFGGRR